MSQTEHVVYTPQTGKMHKRWSTTVNRVACTPNVKGRLTSAEGLDAERCSHQACFGGNHD